MNRSVVGLGSNINPYFNIEQALNHLKEDHRLIKVSVLAVTEPVGFKDQPDFINGAVLVETEMEREEFRQYLKHIEGRLGRKRTRNKYGPRTIDLDIVIWNGDVVDKDYYTRVYLKKSVNEVADVEGEH
jgi:2-amino-4-hydroxy-6-hydroxymethyldihydropteridine diphosphokinase